MPKETNEKETLPTLEDVDETTLMEIQNTVEKILSESKHLKSILFGKNACPNFQDSTIIHSIVFTFATLPLECSTRDGLELMADWMQLRTTEPIEEKARRLKIIP